MYIYTFFFFKKSKIAVYRPLLCKRNLGEEKRIEESRSGGRKHNQVASHGEVHGQVNVV